ncbi:PilW family protein [Acidobacteriota bacterium]
MNIRIAKERGAAGFSLVEFLVAITITLIIMGAVFGLVVHNQQVYEAESNIADMQQNMRIALDLMTREIRMAGSNPTGRAFDTSSGDHAIELGKADLIEIKLDRGRDFWDTTTPPPSIGADGQLEVVDGYTNCNCGDPCNCTPSLGQDARTDCDNEDEYGDGCINDPGEHILFKVVNGTLYRVLEPDDDPVTKTEQPIADNITNLTFTYYRYVSGSGLVPIAFVNDEIPDTSVVVKIRVSITTETEEAIDRSQKPVGKKQFKTESDIFLRNLFDT